MGNRVRTPGGWHLVRDGLPTEKGFYLVVVQSRYLWPEKKSWEYIVDIAESHVYLDREQGVMDHFWCGSNYGFEKDEECHVAAWMDLPDVPFEVINRNDWLDELQKDRGEKHD